MSKKYCKNCKHFRPNMYPIPSVCVEEVTSTDTPYGKEKKIVSDMYKKNKDNNCNDYIKSNFILKFFYQFS